MCINCESNGIGRRDLMKFGAAAAIALAAGGLPLAAVRVERRSLPATVRVERGLPPAAARGEHVLLRVLAAAPR